MCSKSTATLFELNHVLFIREFGIAFRTATVGALVDSKFHKTFLAEDMPTNTKAGYFLMNKGLLARPADVLLKVIFV